MTVLVVEDDPALRTVIRLVLERGGFAVEEAADGHEALQVIAVRPPDLVVADMHMRNITGRELVERIRNGQDRAHTPVLILTGDMDITTATTGADAVMLKPFEPDRLVAALRSLA